MTAKAVRWVAAMLLCSAATGTEWVKRYDGGTGDDEAAAIRLMSGGALYLTGFAAGADSSSDYVTIRYSRASGDSLVATYSYLPAGGQDDEATALAITANGRVCVTGFTSGYDSTEEEALAQYTTIMYNPDFSGETIRHFSRWTVEDPAACANAIAVSGESVYVTGFMYWGDATDNDIVTRGYTATGATCLAWRADGSGNLADEGRAIAADGRGNIYVAGSVFGDTSGTDLVLMRFRPPTNAPRWSRTYDAGQMDYANAVTCDAAGYVYVTGQCSGGDWVTLKYDDSLGNRQWVSTYAGSLTDEAIAMVYDNNAGALYVTGTSQSSTGGQDWLTARLDTADGHMIWTQRYNGPASGDDAPASIALGHDGCVYVAGYRTTSSTGKDYYAVKYSASGASLRDFTWNDTLHNGDDRATGLAVDSSRNVYLTGTSWNGTDFDIVTVKDSQEFNTDVSIVGILSPPGVVEYGDAVVPSVKVTFYNVESLPTDSFMARFTIGDVIGGQLQNFYTDSAEIALAPGETLTVDFRSWTATQGGTHFARCTLCVVDSFPGNEVAESTVTVPAGWKEVRNVPTGARPVKDGGWLAYDPTNGLIYAAKGNKTVEFYKYGPSQNAWIGPLRAIPSGVENKLPSKGCAGCVDPSGYVYMTKGNNTLGFWQYDIVHDTWCQKAPVPLGGGQKVKAGTGLAWVVTGGRGYVYMLKGYKNEFYRYDPLSNSWQVRDSAPVGINRRYDKGSFIVYDGDNTIYAAKAKYNEFWKYDIAKDSWVRQLAGMPLYGASGRKKKSKDGGSGTLVGDCIYALKGGNTQEFWKYVPATDSWKEMDTLPRLGSTGKTKYVKAGGSLASDGSVLFALKGNKCNEFWRFVPSAGGLDAGAPSQGGSVAASGGTTLDGETPVTDGVEGLSPRWNSQGTRAVEFHESPQTGFTQAYQCFPGSANPEEQATDIMEDVEDPVYSPDGRYIAAVVDDTITDCYQLIVTPAYDSVQLDDVALDFIPTPAPIEDSGTQVEPSAMLSYHVSQATAFAAVFRIGTSYRDSIAVNLAAGEADTVLHFATWVAMPGAYGVVCSLYLVDRDLSNNTHAQMTLVPSGSFDGKPLSLSPSGRNARTGTRLTPNAFSGRIGMGSSTAQTGAVSASGPTITGIKLSSRPVWQISTAAEDHCHCEFDPSGQWLTYERDVDEYTQIWRMPVFGGEEQQLTFGNSDHFLPKYLNPQEICFVLSPNDDFDRVAKVNVLSGVVTVLSNLDTDHDQPDPSFDGSSVVAEALDLSSGNSQLVRMSAQGGSEVWLTGGSADIMAPDYGQSSQSVFAVRWTGITSQIVYVDGQYGGFWPVTDSSAIRDNPDVFLSQNQNSAMVIYQREAWDPLYLLPDGKHRHGTGIYLSRYHGRPHHEGTMGTELGILALDGIEPNPTTSRVRIRWQVPVESHASLRVYNTAGQLVKVLADGRVKPGAHTSVWNGTDARGRRLANGVYFCALDNGSKRISRKLVLTK